MYALPTPNLSCPVFVTLVHPGARFPLFVCPISVSIRRRASILLHFRHLVDSFTLATAFPSSGAFFWHPKRLVGFRIEYVSASFLDVPTVLGERARLLRWRASGRCGEVTGSLCVAAVVGGGYLVSARWLRVLLSVALGFCVFEVRRGVDSGGERVWVCCWLSFWLRERYCGGKGLVLVRFVSEVYAVQEYWRCRFGCVSESIGVVVVILVLRWVF